MTFKKILVPIDGSTFSTKALATATEMAKNNGAEIMILACLRKEDVGAWYHNKKANRQVMNTAKKFAKQFMVKIEDGIRKKGLTVSSSIIETKSLVNGIIGFADSKKADLIVMGSHGRTGFKKMLLGSVSNGVLQQARQPVLIVK